jgi:hypothetical protein
MPIKDLTSDSSSSFSLRRKIFAKTSVATTTGGGINPQKRWFGGSNSRDSSFITIKNTNTSIGGQSFNQPIISYHSVNPNPNAGSQALSRLRSSGSTVPPKVSQMNVIPPIVPTVPTVPHIVSVSTEIVSAILNITNISSNTENFAYSLDGGETFTLFNPPQTSSSSLSITGLTSDTTYNFVINAVNGVGVSNLSNIVVATTQSDIVIPNTPQIDSLYFGVNEAYAYISNTDEATTNYTYSLNGGETLTVFDPPQNATSIISFGYFNENINYSLVIKALVGNTMSDNSNIYSFRVLSFPFVNKITTFSVEATDLIISIVGISEEIQIANYQYSFDGGETFTVFDPPQTSKNTITISNLVMGESYIVNVQYYDLDENLSYLSNGIGMVIGAPPCPTIDSVSVVSDNLILTISGTGGAENYNYSLNGTDSWTTFDPPQNSISTLTISGVPLSTTLAVAIQAFNEYGTSFNSNIVNVET